MAKAFQFRLQKILDVKKQLENLISVDLKRSQAELELEQRVVEELHQSKEEILNGNNHSEEELSLSQIQLAMAYIQQLNEMIEKQNEVVKEKEQLVEATREKLIKVSQEKKVVEKLKERHWVEHKKEARKKEMVKESELAQRIFTQKENELELR